MSMAIQGAEELISKLSNLIEAKSIEESMVKACAIVEADAKRKAPKGEGTLKRSIEYKVTIEGDTVKGTVFSPLEYAPYVEFGTGLFAEGGNGRKDVPWIYCDDKGKFHTTRGMPPCPFLRPALAENRNEIVELLKDGVMDD